MYSSRRGWYDGVPRLRKGEEEEEEEAEEDERGARVTWPTMPG